MNINAEFSTFDLKHFKESSVLGIIRGAEVCSISGLLNACVLGGLKYIEFTLNSEESLPCIEFASKEFTGLCVGAGTVLSLSDVAQAKSVGAKFIVSPTSNEDVALYCNDNELAYFPGALTPTEIEKSWNAGATMVKVFPAGGMGPDYISSIVGPFQDIQLLAVGGIKAYNVSEYLQAGASAVAIGGSIFSPSRIKNMEFDYIKEDILKFLFAVKSYYCEK